MIPPRRHLFGLAVAVMAVPLAGLTSACHRQALPEPRSAVRGPASPHEAPPTEGEAASPVEADDTEPDLLPNGDDSDATAPEGAASHDPSKAPPAVRYGALDRTSCEAELVRRHIAFTPVGEARGVVAPLRLGGPLSGVLFRSNLPESKSRTSPYDIYDCRLVLALDDFARVLSRHDIVEVVHLSVYRPVSSRVTLKGPGRRHTGALAIDAAIFKTKDGRTLSVEKDFHGRIGAKPCPARALGKQDASELRKIACEAHDDGLFNVLLTPDFNWAHRNHFHLEVTANVKWTLVR